MKNSHTDRTVIVTITTMCLRKQRLELSFCLIRCAQPKQINTSFIATLACILD